MLFGDRLSGALKNCFTDMCLRSFQELAEEDECVGFFVLGLADESVTRRPGMRIPARENTVWIRE